MARNRGKDARLTHSVRPWGAGGCRLLLRNGRASRPPTPYILTRTWFGG